MPHVDDGIVYKHVQGVKHARSMLVRAWRSAPLVRAVLVQHAALVTRFKRVMGPVKAGL